MALQRTHGPSLRPGRSLRSLGSPLNAQPLGRRILICLLLAVSAVDVAALNPSPSVKGVSLGSAKSKVVKVFGRPIKSKTRVDKEMGQGALLFLTYPGLDVELSRANKKTVRRSSKGLYVSRLLVTGNQWVVSPGVQVGMTRQNVFDVLGAPTSAGSAGGSEVLHYSLFDFDASFQVTLNDGVVVEIVMAEDWS